MSLYKADPSIKERFLSTFGFKQEKKEKDLRGAGGEEPGGWMKCFSLFLHAMNEQAARCDL